MDDQTAWDIYFAGIASIRFHPANDQNHSNENRTIEWAGNMADLMLTERRKRTCPGSPPEQA